MGTGKLTRDSLIYLKEGTSVNGEAKLKKGDIFICTSSGSINHLGKSTFIESNLDYYIGGFCSLLRGDDFYKQKFISLILSYSEQYRDFIEQFKGANINNLKTSELSNFKIPFPPLEIQMQIIKEIEEVEKEEANAEKVINRNEKSIAEIFVNLTGDKTTLGKITTINPSKPTLLKELSDGTEVSFYEMAAIKNEGGFNFHDKKPLGLVRKGFTYFQNMDIIWAKITPCMENGKVALVNNLVNNIGFGSTEFHVLKANETKVYPEIIYYFVKQKWFRLEAEKSFTGASGHKRVPAKFLENYQINLPALSEQKQIVTNVLKLEQQISSANEIIVNSSEKKKNILIKYLQ